MGLFEGMAAKGSPKQEMLHAACSNTLASGTLIRKVMAPLRVVAIRELFEWITERLEKMVINL
jgi:hypothetical protein